MNKTSLSLPSAISSLQNQGGQALMLFVLIIFALVLTVPVAVFVQAHGQKSGVHAVNVEEAKATTVQTIEYVSRALSSGTAWNQALNGQFPAICNGNINTTYKGVPYKVQCSTGAPGTASYQVQVIATTMMQDNGSTWVPIRSVKALLSQSTQEFGLTNVSGVSPALILSRAPNISAWMASDLRVDWGPIVSYGTDVWNIPGRAFIEPGRFPRKFSRGGLTGMFYSRAPTSSYPHTDEKEYWAYSSLGSIPAINFDAYKIRAQNTPMTAGIPVSALTGNPLVASPSNSSYFKVDGDTAIFNTNTLVQSTCAVIYVEGNAQIGDNANAGLVFNLSGDGAFIVTGDLSMSMPVKSDKPVVHVPQMAAKEYPYCNGCSAPYAEPCKGQEGATCTITEYNPYSGFMYVKGNLHTRTPWSLSGVLRVDGLFVYEQDPALPFQHPAFHLYYDDLIGHAVNVNAFHIHIDSMVE